jgi:hypothetical protein
MHTAHESDSAPAPLTLTGQQQVLLQHCQEGLQQRRLQHCTGHHYGRHSQARLPQHQQQQ